MGKSLELLKELRRRASRVAVLANPSNAMHQAMMSNSAPTVAQALGSPSRRLRWLAPDSLGGLSRADPVAR